jgi:hypothetical protein
MRCIILPIFSMADLVHFSMIVAPQTENIRSTQVFDAGIIKTSFANWNNCGKFSRYCIQNSIRSAFSSNRQFEFK